MYKRQKSTRASIIERLYAVRYLKNDPIEPSQLGIAIIDALSELDVYKRQGGHFPPHARPAQR